MNDRQSATILGLLAALYAAALVLLAPQLDSFLNGSASDRVPMLFVGFLFASPPLLAIWAVHGETRVVTRLSVTTWLFAAFFLAASYGQVRNYGTGDGDIILMAAVAWMTAYGALLLLLLLLRAVRGWRLRLLVPVGSPANAPGVTRPMASGARKQFTIRTLLVWTTAAAALCAGFRCLAPYGSFNSEDWPANMLAGVPVEGCIVGLLVALAGLPVLAVAWLLLADGRRPIWRAMLIAVAAGGILGVTALFQSFADGVDLNATVLLRMQELGVLAAGLVAASAMRVCGYRLVRATSSTSCRKDAFESSELRHPGRRFALALAALALLALPLAGYAPRRFEIWRRADEIQRWLALGWQAELDEQGHVIGLYVIPGHDLAGSEVLLAELQDVRKLAFSHSNLTDIQLLQYPIHCRAMAKLEFLDLTGTVVGDEALSHIERFGKLKQLRLVGTNVTDAGLSHLSVLTDLQWLAVSDTSVTLKQAPSLPRLENLSLEGTAVGDTELAQLAAFPNLKTLRLARTNVTDAGLGKLVALRAINSLDLSITEVTDDGAADLAQLTQLRSLNLELTAVSEAVAVRLRKALPEAQITAGANDVLLGPAVQARVVAVPLGQRTSYERIASAPWTLKRLHARGKSVTDAGLQSLAGRTAMEELDLRDSGVTDAGLVALTKLTNLKRLDLRDTAVTDAGRDTLAKALPGCTILR